MSIEWRQSMCVGEATIDEDHKHLVDLINDFEKAIVGKIDHRRLAKVLLGLIDYTGEHFTREEELQLKVRYPYYDSHRKQHRDVLKKLQQVIQEYIDADEHNQDRMIRDMTNFLKEWLVDHIIVSDLRMRPYVAKMAESEKAAARLRRKANDAVQLP